MELKKSEVDVLIYLKACRNNLTPQQYRTLRGQVLAGDRDGAIRGLRKILHREKEGVRML